MIVEFRRTNKSSRSGMSLVENPSWKDRILKPDKVLDKIRPGMNIFLGTGVAEPACSAPEVRQLHSAGKHPDQRGAQ
jgi:hypothetical protein